MNYNGHRNGGIVTSVAVASVVAFYTHNIVATLISAVSAFIFALYPDMDIHSTPRKKFLPIGLISVIVLYLFGHHLESVILVGLLIVPMTQRHRGIMHSILGMVLVSFAWNYMVSGLLPTTELNGYLYGVSAIAGYLTHLLLDTHFRLV